MLGAIIGDLVGSRFEFDNCKSKEFTLFTEACAPTDDSVMTIAIAKAIMNSADLEVLGKNAVYCMRDMGTSYPHAGYGRRFSSWLRAKDPQPYYSYGNGAAMRVSPCGFAAGSLEDAKRLAKAVTEVTHNHPEGLKGAAATASAIFLAREGKSIGEFREYITGNYYPIDFTLDEIRPSYRFHASCQESVPQAMEAFFESTGFEDAIRNAVSIGGDSDTIAAITGGIAEAYYGIPEEIREKALTCLDRRQKAILKESETRYKPYSIARREAE